MEKEQNLFCGGFSWGTPDSIEQWKSILSHRVRANANRSDGVRIAIAEAQMIYTATFGERYSGETIKKDQEIRTECEQESRRNWLTRLFDKISKK